MIGEEGSGWSIAILGSSVAEGGRVSENYMFQWVKSTKWLVEGPVHTVSSLWVLGYMGMNSASPSHFENGLGRLQLLAEAWLGLAPWRGLEHPFRSL